MYAKNKKSLLERLQSADEATKKRLMIIGTVLASAVVVYVWLAYFNNLLAGFSQTAPAAGQTENLTVWQTLKSGFASLAAVFLEKIRAFGDILRAPREYIINPPR